MTSGGQSLEVDGLGVSYGALRALDAVSFRVDPGEILGIIGPNGAGKSTCYNAVTHMVARDGSVRIGDTDVTAIPAHALHEYGLRRAFQQNAFFDDLTVLENMVAVMQHDHGSSLATAVFRPGVARRREAEARGRARELLVHLGVEAGYHDAYPTQISYGTQRALSIALAHSTGADILLLDEPAAGLGGDDMQRLIELMLRLRDEGVTLVVIEHHMDLIMSVTDRIVVLDRGKMIACDTPEAIRNSSAVLEAYLGRTE